MTNNVAARICLAESLNQNYCSKCIHNHPNTICSISSQWYAGLEQPEIVQGETGISCTAYWENTEAAIA